ncbi:MAG: hypothetical protein HOP24_05505 [Sideroxydans sp.]|nr:hypothetical protein [Sideroxydans sp.]
MKFDGGEEVWLWRFAVVAIMVISAALIGFEHNDLNSAFALLLFFGFAVAGVKRATKKGDHDATEFSKRIVASALAAIKQTVEISVTNVAILATTPVFLPRPERRVNPPKKIQAPTLYPRLASTPWLVRA